MGRLPHLLALERPHQYSSIAAMAAHHDSYSSRHSSLRSSVMVHSVQRGQNKCTWNIELFASITAEVIIWSYRHWSLDAVCAFMTLNPVTHSWLGVTLISWFDVTCCPRCAWRSFVLQSSHDLCSCASQHETTLRSVLIALKSFVGMVLITSSNFSS